MIVEKTAPGKVDLKIKSGGKLNTRSYTYDSVFGPESTNVEVYSDVVSPCVEEVLEGYNCTVFAYGQTGTGKTYTMEGERIESPNASHLDENEQGLIPRALCHFFEKLEKKVGTEFSVRCSFIEIYNEDIFDLLSAVNDHNKLRLFDDQAKKGSVIIQNVEEVPIRSRADIYGILKKGTEKRRVAETKMNKASSRSHSVFSVTVHQKESTISGEEVMKTGKLYLVDLAGRLVLHSSELMGFSFSSPSLVSDDQIIIYIRVGIKQERFKAPSGFVLIRKVI